MNTETTIELTTERLTLRPLTPADAATAHEYAGDEENTVYMVNLPNKTFEDTKRFINRAAAELTKENPLFYEFAVILKDSGRHIGGVGLDVYGREGELGWIIRKDKQGKGYAAKAARAVLDFALNKLKLKKITACCDYRNAASYRVMEKIGMTLERDDGIRPYKDNGADVRELVYSITRV